MRARPENRDIAGIGDIDLPRGAAVAIKGRGVNPMRPVPCGHNGAGMIDTHDPRFAHGSGTADKPGALTDPAKQSATAANRLGKDRRRPFPKRHNRAAACYRDVATIAACTSACAKGNCVRIFLALGAPIDIPGKPTAAADRLGEYPEPGLTCGQDNPLVADIDRAAIAARPARTTKRHGAGLTNRAVTAHAAAAANRLRKDTN